MIDQRLVELWETSGAREKGVSLAYFKTQEEEKDPGNLRIGFCTAIKGPERFPLLLKSLQHNLQVFNDLWAKEHYKPRVHFVILAYGEPELEAYIRANLEAKPFLKKAFENGTVILARCEAEHFEYAAAKNTAARVAIDCLKCAVVCNLDGDNLIGGGGNARDGTEDVPDFITFLKKTFKRNRDAIVRPVYNDGPHIGFPIARGIGGRIAIAAANFRRVRGYDEENFALWGGDDRDFMRRAMSLQVGTGYEYLRLIPVADPLTAGSVLQHSSQYRWQNLPPELREAAREREINSGALWAGEFTDEMGKEMAYLRETEFPAFHRSRSLLPVIFANPNGWKCNEVEVAHYDPASNHFEFERRNLYPLYAIGETEREQEAVFSPEMTEAARLSDRSVLAGSLAGKFDSLPDFDCDAIIFAAHQERKLGGFQPIERVALTIFNRTRKNPAEMERLRRAYQGYLDDRERLNPRQTPAGSFAERYGRRSGRQQGMP